MLFRLMIGYLVCYWQGYVAVFGKFRTIFGYVLVFVGQDFVMYLVI